ncbi:MAG: cyclic nucleotide-binding domain-containing protein [Thermodesulfovibrionia bacterium]|nr:cyclic nucleotide-binding domain-containing protein [Thermodesulfovibrionia bacterium]
MEIILREHISKIPLFSEVDHDELFTLLNTCTVEVFDRGEKIYNYGDYGEDCCVILSGRVRVELSPANTFGEILLGEGDIFGEIAALSGYVRTADVVPLKRTEVLVIPKETLLNLFDKFPLIKSRIDALYCERVLASQLPSIPIFMGLTKDIIEELIDKATLHTYNSGEAVFHQGDEADAFYVVRYGLVKITETGADGRKRVLAYLKAGHYFGEMALVNENEKRMATITAISRTELIKVSRADFQNIIELHPRVKTSLETSIEKIKQKNMHMREDEHMEKTLRSVIDMGIVQSKEVLVIDITKCINCDNCLKACGALHNDQVRLVRKGVALNNNLLIASSCWHCENPSCMIKCPTGAINRGFEGEIYHNKSCIACGLCAKNCPYGNIFVVALPDTNGNKDVNNGFLSRYFKKRDSRQIDQEPDVKRKPKRMVVKCDMCREHPFMGCVYNCPTGAARKIDTSNFFTDVINLN